MVNGLGLLDSVRYLVRLCCPPSPLAHYYSSLTLSDRYAWPHFLGDWAFEDGQYRRGELLLLLCCLMSVDVG